MAEIKASKDWIEWKEAFPPAYSNTECRELGDKGMLPWSQKEEKNKYTNQI